MSLDLVNVLAHVAHYLEAIQDVGAYPTFLAMTCLNAFHITLAMNLSPKLLFPENRN